MVKLLYGVGIYEKGNHLGAVKRKSTKLYKLWAHMIERSYCPKYQTKQPSYVGCTVSNNFKNFQYFAEWCNNQIGFGNEGWCLDKDILVKGNKIYSEDTCVFVPRVINCLFADRGTNWGTIAKSTKVGRKRRKPFVAAISKNNKTYYLGSFATAEEARSIYFVEKKKYLSEICNKFSDKLDPRVIKILLEWEA